MYAYPIKPLQETVDKIFYSGAGRSIPTTIVGLHPQTWPSVALPTLPFSFGVARSHDCTCGEATDRLLWAKMHTAAGVFHWTLSDTFIDAHAAAGRKVYWQIQSTPAWDSTGATVDAYGQAGGDLAPLTVNANGLYTHLYDFVVALLTRYAGKIFAISPWNEPAWLGTRGKFWAGTEAQMAKVVRTVREAARSVDPTVIVTCPDFADTSLISAFMAVSDSATGALSPQTAVQNCDAWVAHSYNGNSFASNTGSAIHKNISLFKDLLVAGGVANPVMYLTECGWTSAATTFFLLTPAEQAKMIGRCYLHAGAMGLSSYIIYGYETSFSGTIRDNPAAQAIIEDIHTRFAGQTFTEIAQTTKGRIKCTKVGGEVLYFL